MKLEDKNIIMTKLSSDSFRLTKSLIKLQEVRSELSEKLSILQKQEKHQKDLIDSMSK